MQPPPSITAAHSARTTAQPCSSVPLPRQPSRIAGRSDGSAPHRPAALPRRSIRLDAAAAPLAEFAPASLDPLPHEAMTVCRTAGARLVRISSVYFLCKLCVALHPRRRPSATPRRPASKPPPVPDVTPPIPNSLSPVPIAARSQRQSARLCRRPSQTPRRQPSQTSPPCPHAAALQPRCSPSWCLPRRRTGLPVRVGVFS
jgi:hypothetical protein